MWNNILKGCEYHPEYFSDKYEMNFEDELIDGFADRIRKSINEQIIKDFINKMKSEEKREVFKLPDHLFEV